MDITTITSSIVLSKTSWLRQETLLTQGKVVKVFGVVLSKMRYTAASNSTIGAR